MPSWSGNHGKRHTLSFRKKRKSTTISSGVEDREKRIDRKRKSEGGGLSRTERGGESKEGTNAMGKKGNFIQRGGGSS